MISVNLFRSYYNLKRIEKLLSVCLLFLLFLEIGFIFSNSFDSASQSTGKSGVIVTFCIENILGIDISQASDDLVRNITYYIRKLAHFTEFAVMSATFSSILAIHRIVPKKMLMCSSLFSFAVGLIDEMIQLFSDGRACRFTDVIIDLFGGFSGALFVTLLSYIIALKITPKSSNTTLKGKLE